MFVNDIKSHAF